MSAVRGWTDAPLGHLVAIKKGRKVPTSLALLPGYEPYLGASALEAEPTEYAATKGAVRASESDLLLLWDGERSGLVGKGRPGVVASTVARLTTSAEIETLLVLHLLRWKFDWIQSQRTGTGVPHVPSDLAKRMRLRFPSSRTEQLRIADVLDNMDRIIEAAATLVAKLTALKHGVVADLLTRGIGPNGEIRNWKDDKEFKLSVIGPIPESWDVAGFGDIVIEPGGLKPGPFGSSLTKREFVVESQFRVYGQEQVLAGSLDHGDYFISESKYRELAAFSVMPRDLLVTMVGVGTIGKVLIVRSYLRQGRR